MSSTVRSSGLAVAAVVLAAGLFCGCGKRTPPAPQPAPAVKLKLLQAPQAELDGWSGLRGKIVVVEFWATWCDACVEEMPHLNGLADRFQGRPVQFLFVTADPEKEVKAFLKTHPLHGWVGLDAAGAAFQAFDVYGLPHTTVLGADGMILGETYPNLLTPEMLEEMLAGRKPAA